VKHPARGVVASHTNNGAVRRLGGEGAARTAGWGALLGNFSFVTEKVIASAALGGSLVQNVADGARRGKQTTVSFRLGVAVSKVDGLEQSSAIFACGGQM